MIRLVAAILIVASHSAVLSSFNQTLDTYLINIIFRWCVPFFFVTSGYFMKDNWKDFSRYIKRILGMYIFWTIIYMVLTQINIENFKDLLLYFIRGNISVPFWYFPSLILCMFFVFVLKKIIKNPFYICLFTSILFAFAMIGGTYLNVPIFNSVINTHIMVIYKRIFVTTRNGILWGSFYVSIGLLISSLPKEKICISKWKDYVLVLLVSFIFSTIETVVIINMNLGERDILVMSIPLTILIFIGALNVQVSKQLSLIMRNMSVFIYVTHYFIITQVFDFIDNSFMRFVYTLVCCIALSYILSLLSQRIKMFKFIC